jgi:uncharacterized protein (DUF1697 family)
MSGRYVVLLRGINVGSAKRIAMADLRAVFEGLGHTAVRTVLQSGNVVLEARERPEASELTAAVEEATGVRSAMIVLPEARFGAVLAANPLLELATDPSRMFITFLDRAPDASADAPPSDEAMAPERLVLGDRAVYQWIPDGLLATRVPPVYFKRLGTVGTTRNLRTAQRIAALL